MQGKEQKSEVVKKRLKMYQMPLIVVEEAKTELEVTEVAVLESK